MKKLLSLALIMLGACSAQPSIPAGPVAGEVNCIDLTQVTARRVVPPGSVLFEMPGGISYRNDLQGSCPSAARANGSEIIQTETQSTRLCRDDRIRIYDPVEAKATGARSFPQCRLGSFVPVPLH
jgi:hypothetical protein